MIDLTRAMEMLAWARAGGARRRYGATSAARACPSGNSGS